MDYKITRQAVALDSHSFRYRARHWKCWPTRTKISNKVYGYV